ncbi:MAG: polyprenyl synthetase family protein [Spirochaetota bacterium]
MFPDLQRHRESVLEQVKALLQRAKAEYAPVNAWAEDLMDRLALFCAQGKMLRGALVLFSHGLFKEVSSDAVRAAAALELIHSSLLIHDDIMDRDLLRRGQRTIFAQYAEVAQGEGSPGPGEEAYHHGESLGMCAGDIGFFLAFGELALLQAPQPVIRQLVQRWSRELAAVGLAQMEDIGLGLRAGPVREEDVLRLYRYKTARYTFSLPLWTGALLAGQQRAVRERLEEVGETLGVIFQIKDDELGLFGSARRTGKPVGGDLQEGKRTLYRIYLEELASGSAPADALHPAPELSPAQRERLARVLSGEGLGDDDLAFVRLAVREHGVQDRVSSLLDRLVRRAREQIGALPLDGPAREQFLGMLAYNLERSR